MARLLQRELKMSTSIFSSRKLLWLICFLMLGLALVFLTVHMQSKDTAIFNIHAKPGDLNEDTLQDKEVQTVVDKVQSSKLKHQDIPSETTANSVKQYQHNEVHRKDEVDNSGAINYLVQYKKLFGDTATKVPLADPNHEDTITTWWQAAAMIDWYINSPLRHNCENKVAYGNWHVCQDKPYTVKPPCLVYSFGINFDFSFDDAMAKLGCEVHSFDPSMNQSDHKRDINSTFHNLGLSNTNTDGFIARKDSYVTSKQVWKMRTLKSVKKMLGHEKRVIDVLKIDIEGHEWDVVDNLMETNMFPSIRQFMLEFHLFPDWPVKEDYVYLYKIYTRLREMGFREYSVGPHPKTLNTEHFNNQGDSEFVNAFFSAGENWR
ncbi:uncharacterized protein LOC131934455 isoform X2 [Physella acuta]|uniref:uncharacterized protein LOC131934455 isoform X2 n=1 Tax=Physella acuta TaxID=109671 RepID=UPI0027DC83B1|nr:uncharacterized protein LOC131934455 isoform X2 [Physella acuta]